MKWKAPKSSSSAGMSSSFTRKKRFILPSRLCVVRQESGPAAEIEMRIVELHHDAVCFLADQAQGRHFAVVALPAQKVAELQVARMHPAPARAIEDVRRV